MSIIHLEIPKSFPAYKCGDCGYHLFRIARDGENLIAVCDKCKYPMVQLSCACMENDAERKE